MIHFAGSELFLLDDKAFLFTLRNRTGMQAMMPVEEDGGVLVRSEDGFGFGRLHQGAPKDKFFLDFEIRFGCAYSTAEHTRGFRYPQGHKNNSFLAGSNAFRVEELEVFSICPS
eukprot:Seg851.2 transcript_id=Seg851.2/GoldUCD/mRNA.D3Y31 product="hypothetical protein" protein_id=Seg851.2/GoldUCD/D3Y31